MESAPQNRPALPTGTDWSNTIHLLLGLVIVFGMIGYLLRASYIDALDAAKVTSSNLASTLETRLDATLRRTDAILSGLVHDLQAEELTQAKAVRHAARIDSHLDDRTQHFPELAGLRIFDANGQLLYTNARHALMDRPHVDDREFFTRLRDDPKLRRVFSKTFKVRSTNTHSIGVAYPLRSGDGRFLGIALALINLDYFQHYLSTLEIGKQGTFSIRRIDDFTLVLRQPNIEEELNQSLPVDNPTRQAVSNGQQKATVEFMAQTDGVKRIFSLQTLQEYPYYVTVAIGHDDALTAWNIRARLTLGSLLVLLILLAYQQLRVRRSEQSLRQSIAALTLSEQFAKTTIDAVPEHICVLDRNGKILAVNRAWRHFCDNNEHPVASGNYGIGAHYLDVYGFACPQNATQMAAGLDQVLAGASDTFELEYACDKPTEKRAFMAHISRFHGNSGNILISHANITARKQAEGELQLFASLFNSSNEAIVITDADNRIITTNPAFTNLTGYTQDEVAGQDPRILSAGKTPPELYAEMWQDINRDGHWQGELWDRRKSGEPYPKWLSIAVVRDRAGKIINYIGSFIDITERKASEEKIRYLAYHDALTDLPNRFSLNERLVQALGFSRRNQQLLALLLIDLDRFKVINDTLGHAVGDELLVLVAKRLRSAVRDSDIVARLGGDEFVIVLPCIDSPDDAAAVASKILSLIAAPYVVANRELRTAPSIGISIYPHDSSDPLELLKNADVAMYHAKEMGRGNYQFYKDELQSAAVKRLSIEDDLRKALVHRQFVLHYQPQLDLRSGRLVGVEALIRWQHPERGMIPPLDFIPIAEETGLILPIGEWVMEQACKQLALWRKRGIKHIKVSVNLTASQFLSEHLADRIHALLLQYDVDPGLLDLEVTESMSMANPHQSIATMKEISRRGISLSIDDFGTGYSSLAYLKLFPISTLKIDRSFVKDIETDSNDADICDVTVLLAHKLGLDVVAEGVETEAQLKFLLSIGCEKIQGYLISKPLPADEAEAFILNNDTPMAGLGTIDLW